ncbi:ABC transporter substrate-binding protein [Variovorax sp. MHTC-1]|nr:ABC transporter substrate-binding protein [Variovorax sp. MHTC-1]
MEAQRGPRGRGFHDSITLSSMGCAIYSGAAPIFRLCGLGEIHQSAYGRWKLLMRNLMNGNNLRLLLCALMLAAAPVAEAQQARKVPRVGYLAAVSASADAPRLEAFRQGLRDLGYVEGQNIQIDYRHEGLDLERLPSHAAELLRLEVDVLVTVTTNAALAAKKTTGTIPIVFMGVTDPITTGLAETLARPGGNSTGITNVAAVLAGKRLELLKETMPKVTRVAVLWDRKAPGSIPQWEESQAPAKKLGLELYSMEAGSVDEYVASFTQAVKARNDAVWVTLNPVANSNQKLIAELAIANGLPSICARGDYAENGCLMAYGPGYGMEGKDGARYVDRILKGAKPADLPIEQPTKFELLINLKTAKRIGFTIPRSVLHRADKVIQ